jgi:hypothetical protein
MNHARRRTQAVGRRSAMHARAAERRDGYELIALKSVVDT